MSESKTEYEVLADGTAVFEFNDRGNMVHKKRYRKGDMVPLREDQAQALLRHGAIRDPEEATEDAEDTGAVPVATEGTEGQSGTDEDSGIFNLDDDGKIAGKVDDEGDDDDEDSDAPDYEAMDYPELQALAKARTGNGGGSKADLIERLRAHDDQS